MPDRPTPALLLRLMTATDIPTLVILDGESRPRPWTMETFSRELNNPIAHVTVADAGESLLGFILTWIVGDELQIHHIAVRRSDRGRGLGERLLRYALTAGRQNGAILATLEVRSANASARRLYEKCGFVEVGRRPGYYRQPADDAILMNADLSDEIS